MQSVKLKWEDYVADYDKNYYLGSLIFSASWYSLCVCVTFSLVLTILRQTLKWNADYHCSFASSTLQSCISQKIMISLKKKKNKKDLSGSNATIHTGLQKRHNLWGIT